MGEIRIGCSGSNYASRTFLRFHHGHRGRRGNYSRMELVSWAERIARATRQADVYAYFNNDREGFAVQNGLELKRLLGSPNPGDLQGKSVDSRIS